MRNRFDLAVACAAVVIAASACARGGVSTGEAPVLTTPPPALAARPLEYPPFEETTLANGLRLIVVEHGTQPIVNVNLYVGAGSSADPVERAGLAGMTADLLTKGTTTRSATEISETIESVGGTIGANAGADWITLSANVLAEHLPLAMELVSESAIEATFPETEVELTRRLTLSGLQSALGQPGTIAQRTFDREVFGSEHPYGVKPIPGSVEAVTREEIQAFHERRFSAANALLVISGDVQFAEAVDLARRYFGDWRQGEPIPVNFPAPRNRAETEIHLVHRPGSAQTNILVGHIGLRPDTPDYYPLLVLNGVVGGGPDARLFQILREEKGWTYGSYSRFTRPLEIGYFSASAEVRPEVTDSTIVEILAQLHRIRNERVPEDELEAAKGFLSGSFPLRIETAAQIGAQIATTRLLGLPIEHVTEYRERVRAVTAEDVQRVAREYVRPEEAIVVVVGDAGDLLPRLEAIAPVRLFDVEGSVLEPGAIEN